MLKPSPSKLRYTVALGACLGAPAFAAGLNVGVEIPRLDVAEYHRPYVAIWLERSDNTVASTLSVWYDVKLKNAEGTGTKWLKDMRQWWRRAGRDLEMPIDGVTSPTRPAGKHQLQFTEGKNPLAALPPGNYKLVVEAAREVGGREVVSIPVTIGAAKPTSYRGAGTSELGAVKVAIKP